jgi:hypothetical protein
MTIEIKHRYTGEVLYASETKTLIAALEEAVAGDAGLRGANLRGANLRGANLRGANLREADLRGADLREADLCDAGLRGANLRGANLREANLREADLRGADLREADLCEADLCGADLRGADLREADLCYANLDEPICRMDFGGWSVCIRSEQTAIGCQVHSNEQWLEWDPDDVDDMHINAAKWWGLHGPAVKAAICVVMAKAKKGAQ